MIGKIRNFVLASIAIAVGFVVLSGYFIDLPALSSLRALFLQWAVILAAVALLVGLANLARVHWNKIKTRQPGGAYSFVLLVSMIVTLLVVGFLGPTGDWSVWIFEYIVLPVESSLMALLVVVLVYAGVRLLNRRIDLTSLLFLGTALFILIGTVSLPGVDLPVLRDVRIWVSQVLALAGARGILLGVGLGTIATGLRILLGADRPYGG
ncbi:MAG: hypothetical protein JXB15_14255 [Anaerolineales bacterium]|nr:hypothetical protein [Anaerolineales bacterium]